LVTQKSFGLNIDWLDAAAFREIIPDINPEGLLGGTFSPDDGSASPLLTNHAYYTHAQSLGVEFHFCEPVRKMQLEHGKIVSLTTDLNTYSAGVVVNCAGAWAAEVGKLAGVDLPVRPDSHEAAITEPVARFLGPMIVDIRPAPGSTNYYSISISPGRSSFASLPHLMPGDLIRVRPAPSYPWYQNA